VQLSDQCSRFEASSERLLGALIGDVSGFEIEQSGHEL
jgi:hypothetical protein